jgi:hypothetical protein
MSAVTDFINIAPTTENYLRGIVLFGRNVASYKFALAKSLFDLAAEDRSAVSLEELAVPFGAHLCEQLREAPRQTTAAPAGSSTRVDSSMPATQVPTNCAT